MWPEAYFEGLDIHSLYLKGFLCIVCRLTCFNRVKIKQRFWRSTVISVIFKNSVVPFKPNVIINGNILFRIYIGTNVQKMKDYFFY